MKRGELLGNMIVLATNAHAGQYDKAGQPYILHALKVMHYTDSEDEEILAIAVGHDVLEDTKTTIEELVDAGMTTRVVEGILALTKMPGENLKGYKKRVFANKDAMLVKMADLKHNSDIRRLKGVTEKDIQRMAKYMQFYTEIQAQLLQN